MTKIGNETMLRKLIQGLKEMKIRDIAIWFVLSFVIVLLIYLYIVKRTFDGSLLIETFGFAIVFVLMMVGTKSYGYFVDEYYQTYIDRQNRKNKKHKAKCSKK